MGSAQSSQTKVDSYPAPAGETGDMPKQKSGFSSWRMDGGRGEQRASIAEAQRDHLLSTGQGKIDNPFNNVMPMDAVGQGTTVAMYATGMNYALGKKRRAELEAQKVKIPDFDEDGKRL